MRVVCQRALVGPLLGTAGAQAVCVSLCLRALRTFGCAAVRRHEPFVAWSHCREHCGACCTYLALQRAGAASAASLLAGKVCCAVVCWQLRAPCCLVSRSRTACVCRQAHLCVCCVCVAWVDAGGPCNGWLAFCSHAAQLHVSALSSCFVSIAHTGTSTCSAQCMLWFPGLYACVLSSCARAVICLNRCGACHCSQALQQEQHQLGAANVARFAGGVVCALRSSFTWSAQGTCEALLGVLICQLCNRRPGTCVCVYVAARVAAASCLCASSLAIAPAGPGCVLLSGLPKAILHEQVWSLVPVVPLSWACALQHPQCVSVFAMLSHTAHPCEGGAICLGCIGLALKSSFKRPLLRLLCSSCVVCDSIHFPSFMPPHPCLQSHRGAQHACVLHGRGVTVDRPQVWQVLVPFWVCFGGVCGTCGTPSQVACARQGGCLC
jgi:hypothetical protein